MMWLTIFIAINFIINDQTIEKSILFTQMRPTSLENLLISPGNSLPYHAPVDRQFRLNSAKLKTDWHCSEWEAESASKRRWKLRRRRGKDRGQYHQTPLIRLTVRKRKTNHARGEGQKERKRDCGKWCREVEKRIPIEFNYKYF